MTKNSPGWLNKIWGQEKNVSMHGRLCQRTEVYTIQAGCLKWIKAHKKHVFELIFGCACCLQAAQIKKIFFERRAGTYALEIGHIYATYWLKHEIHWHQFKAYITCVLPEKFEWNRIFNNGFAMHRSLNGDILLVCLLKIQISDVFSPLQKFVILFIIIFEWFFFVEQNALAVLRSVIVDIWTVFNSTLFSTFFFSFLSFLGFNGSFGLCAMK